ncbi:unnamed protein product [Lactuca saligna]|uniref:Myb/SANT-like domain-containing protein n=1 Tax=Lactuca saligna TaxID=75948 RepID=A0AA35ZGY1_LACSI|nr:unnamed protein product [Lactuca saligna]
MYRAIMNKRAADGSVVKKENLTWTDNMDNALVEALVKEDDIGNRANPEAAAFRTKKISNYNQLEMLFSDDRASGSKAETAKEKNARLSKSKEIKIEKIADVEKLMANKEVSLENVHKDDDEDIQIVSVTDVSPDGSSKAKKLKSKKRKLESKFQDEDEVVVETEPKPQPQPESFEHNIVQTFKEIVDVMREGNKSRDYTGEEIEKELELMGLDDDEFADAFIYLSRNQADARTIFSSSMRMRNIFLRKMMCEAKN